MSHKRILVLFAFIAITGLLAGCTGASTTEQIHDHLEKTVELEKGFDKQQKPIVELEKEEQEIYDKIVDLNMDEIDKIQSLADDAIGVINDRRDKLDKEKESINEAKEEFKKIKDLIEELEDDKVKEKAGDMYDVMMDRFDAYDELHTAYITSLDEEEKMYNMLKKEDLKQEDLTEQIKTVNESYDPVLEANETFNEYTVDYNDLKKEFYKAAGIETKDSDNNESNQGSEDNKSNEDNKDSENNKDSKDSKDNKDSKNNKD